MTRRHRLVTIALTALLLAGSGCAGFGGTGGGMVSSTTTDGSISTTPPSTATTAPTIAPTTTTRAQTSTAVLTDRTPPTRLELHPEPGFTGRIRVTLDGDEIYDENFTDYPGFADTDLSDDYPSGVRYEVRVVVTTENDTQVWQRHVGETEGYELDVLENGTIRVRTHVIS